MSESLQKNRLYEYKANSNLVLEADRDKRRRDEGSAEVESLYGKLGGIQMGDRNYRNNISLESSEKRIKLNSEQVVQDSAKLLPINNDRYNPKTKESRLAYEEILSFVTNILGDQPHDILIEAVNEIISLLHNSSIRENQKFDECRYILGKVSIDEYSKLLLLSKKLSDYSINSSNNENKTNADMDDEIGVAVVFDDDDDAVIEDIDDNDLQNEDNTKESIITSRQKENSTDINSADKSDLNPVDIDAHWLQRQVSKFTADANASSKIADEIMEILSGHDYRVIENRLVILLQFEKFDFIKVLLRNKDLIYYCTRYKQAQNEDEKHSIEKEMLSESSGVGKSILDVLQQKTSSTSWAQDRIGEYTSKSRKEAQALRSNEPAPNTYDADDNVLSAMSSHISQPKHGLHKVLDLESLQFQSGGHFMSNEHCELPNKSWRALKKGYEEVHVPAIRPVIPSSEVLVSIPSLPSWCQPAFEGMKNLNRIQSKMLPAALYGSENILLCAPTGSGKTNVALLCMLNQIGRHRDAEGNFELDKFKIVYIAPMKALVQECVQNFSKKLQPFGMRVNELSGDQNLSKVQLMETNVIVTTPEKWDIITRKSGDKSVINLVRLIIIDEVHLLHDDRGPVLEAIVARTLRYIESTGDMIRLVGLSATLPNFEDVAAFLRVDPEKGLFFFDNSFRPVPLQQQFIGITEKKAFNRYRLMNEICYEKVQQHAGRNQILVFTHSRADTVKTAKALRNLAIENEKASDFVKDDSASKEILHDEAMNSVKNSDLKDLLPYGFAVHHAGLLRSDRTLVEDLFADKHIQVLVSTATLAWGVNLPCHTVIIKGTQIYSPDKGQWVEMSPLDILQMIGRAGRYGLDSEGEGIILTSHDELQFYLSLLNQQLPIESQLIKKLPDMLNAEVVLGNIATVTEAVEWLGYTFLFIRMLRNPKVYGIVDIESDPMLLERRFDLVHTSLTILEKHGLVKYDRRSGCIFSNSLGRIASYFYVNHDSIHLYNDFMKPDMTEIEIFRLFSLSHEFKSMYVRDEEKLELAKLVSRVPIPIKENIDEVSAKVNVLLQSYVSRLRLEGFSLCADMIFIQQSACRLLRALFEISLRRGWASLSFKLLNIAKMTEKRLWLSQSPLRQFNGIPEMIVRKIEKSSDLAWSQFFDLKPQDLAEIVKIPKMGKTLHKFVHMFPKLELSANVLPITRTFLRIELKLTPDFIYDTNFLDPSTAFWVFVHDVDGENLLHYESFSLNFKNASLDHYLNFYISISEPIPPLYFVKVIADRWLGCDITIPVSFRDIILPTKFAPSTELLDLQPIPISGLKNKNAINFFRGVEVFNPIQTQAFSTLYEGNSNVLLSTPSNSGAIVCAELAIINHILNRSGKVVFITPRKEFVKYISDRWHDKFATHFNVSVNALDADIAVNLKIFEKSDVVVCSVEDFYPVSKRWKQRRSIQEVGLYIFDDLHYIGRNDGHLYEVLVSRTRYASSQSEIAPRIVGMTSPLANAREVGEWIGAPSFGIFNFPPSSRPFPVETHFLNFDTFDYKGRIQSMLKSTFNVMKSSNRWIVFVGSGMQAKLFSIDYSAHIQSHRESADLPSTSMDISNNVDDVIDITLKNILVNQVAYVNDDMSTGDFERVKNLFESGDIKAVFVPFNYRSSFELKSLNVVVMDTVNADDYDNLIDYNVHELLNILESVAISKKESSAKVYVLSHSSKKLFLKKIMLEPYPVESQVHGNFHDHLNVEIVLESIENKQHAIDFLTWSFLYRRLAMNPNFYNLLGTTHRHISDFLSDLVENVSSDLESAHCISIENDFDLRALNLGMIASYYDISYTTVELFSSSLTAKTKFKGLIDIVSASPEFSSLYVRDAEYTEINDIAASVASANSANMNESSKKVMSLIHAHLLRKKLSPSLYKDLRAILKSCSKFVPAIVDIISSQGWFKTAMAAMELSQMISQGLRIQDSVLLQIPHFDSSIVEKLTRLEPPVETVFDFIDLDDAVRNRILHFDASKLSDVALFCNAYPIVEVNYELSSHEAVCEESITVSISITYDGSDSAQPVVSYHSTNVKSMGWWVVLGDKENNSLLSIKKVASSQSKVNIAFNAHEVAGDYDVSLFLVNDSYIGCDQEFSFPLKVVKE